MGCIAALVGCDWGAPLPRPGFRDAEREASVALGDVRLQLVDGNVSSERVDLVLDTRVGQLEHGAVFNAVSKAWLWRHEMSLRGDVFVDESGAELDLTGTPDGAAIAGTHWVRLDAHRVRTKGGRVYAFDPDDGRLLEVRWADGPHPALRYIAAPIAGAQRIVRIEQCVDDATCSDQLVFEYDASGCLSGAVDRAGRRAEYVHDPACRTWVARDAFEVEQGLPGRRYAYGGLGRLRAIEDSEGQRTELDYDAEGRLGTLRRIGEGDPTFTVRYHGSWGRRTSKTVLHLPSGGAWRYAFDAEHRLIRRTSPEGVTTSWTWSGARPASLTDAQGAVWRFAFEQDDLVRIDRPSGRFEQFSWARGAVDRSRPNATPIARVSDALGVRESRVYDASGRLTTIENGAGESNHFEWDALGQLIRQTAPDGRTTEFGEYGEHGHAVQLVHPSGLIERRLFDAVGNFEAGEELGGDLGPGRPGLVRRIFDAGRSVAEVVTVETVLDAHSIIMKTTRIERRSDGQVRSIETPYGGVERFTYDRLGRLVERSDRVDGVDRIATIAYDVEGRVVEVIRANGMRTEIGRDGDGRPVHIRRLLAGAPSEQLWLTWSGARLVGIDDAAHPSREQISYDVDGHVRERLHAGGGRTQTETDARGREVRRRVFGPVYGAALFEITRTFDGADRLLTTSLDGELLSERTWGSGRVEQRRFGNGLVRHFEFDPQTGALAATRMLRDEDGAVVEDLRIDRVACGIEKLCVDVTGPVQLAGVAGGAPVANWDEEHYWIAWPPGVRSDRPLPGSWLKSWKWQPHSDMPDGDRVQYDALGNISAFRPQTGSDVVFELNAEHNRLVSGGFDRAHTFRYDASGFVTARDGVVLEWTPSGRLARVGEDAVLEWDALGRLRSRTLGGVTRRFGYGGTLEVDAQGWPIAAEIDGVHVALGTAVRRYAHRDFRGNVQLVSDESGRVVRRHVYDAFGARHVVDRDGTRRAPMDGERGFAGGLHVAGLQLLGARPYDPSVGRFLAPDPVDSVLNDFTYTRGNPVRLWDPGGMQAAPVEGPPGNGALGQTLVTGGEVTAITGGAVAAAGIAAGAPPAVLGGSIIFVVGLTMLYFGHRMLEPIMPDGPSEITPDIAPDDLDESVGELSSSAVPQTCAPSTFQPRRPGRSAWWVLGLVVLYAIVRARPASAR